MICFSLTDTSVVGSRYPRGSRGGVVPVAISWPTPGVAPKVQRDISSGILNNTPARCTDTFLSTRSSCPNPH